MKKICCTLLTITLLLTLSSCYFALPSKFLCDDDCKGLCPKCGANLNEGPCECKKDIDPRFEALLSLLDE